MSPLAVFLLCAAVLVGALTALVVVAQGQSARLDAAKMRLAALTARAAAARAALDALAALPILDEPAPPPERPHDARRPDGRRRAHVSRPPRPAPDPLPPARP